jgi:Na+/H+-dicarboxylate symporter
VTQLNREAFSSEPFTRDTAAELIQKFFSIVPENLLDPFRDFNTAQLIMMGIVLAYAVMAVGQQASGLAAFIRQLNLISTQLAQWIAELMPVFTVFLTAQLVISRNATLLVSLMVVIPFSIIVSLLVMAAILLMVGRRSGVKAGVLLKKLWPTFILTLRSGLDGDSYALSEKCCIKSLGIQKIFTQRVLPLGLVLYMPASIVGMISFVVFAALRDGVAITPVWILTAIVFALILLVAAPPIPGVNLLSYVVIIGQLGLGKEYVIAAMIFDILFNAFASAANQTMLRLDMILQAERMGLLNRNVLRSDGGINVTA